MTGCGHGSLGTCPWALEESFLKRSPSCPGLVPDTHPLEVEGVRRPSRPRSCIPSAFPNSKNIIQEGLRQCPVSGLSYRCGW